MAYSSGGLIEATDYNNFLNGSNQLNKVWSTGNGNAGYGQSALSTVSAGGTVTATQWATLINTLNSTLTHQSGSGSGISAPTAGSTIAYLSALSTSIGTAYSNRLNKASNGSTSTGSVYSPNVTSTNTVSTQTISFTRTVSFSSGDAARYFFNCGGYINFVTTSAVSNDGSGRSNDLATTIGTYLGSVTGFGAAGNNGRTGTGGTLNTNATTLGYFGLTTSGQSAVVVNSTTYPYAGDSAQVNFRSNGSNLSGNGDAGSIVYIDGYAASPVYSGLDAWNHSINVTWNYRIDIVYPESSNLTNSWGTVTVS